MPNKIEKLIPKLNSQLIFLLDAIGAFLSGLGAFSIVKVCAIKFNHPLESHENLPFFIFFIMLYSANCYRFNLSLKPFLVILILFNLTYLSYFTQLTIANIDTIPTPILLFFFIDAVAILAVIVLEIFILKKDINNSEKGKSV